MRYDFFRDRTAAFEAFKSGDYLFPRGVHLPRLGDRVQLPGHTRRQGRARHTARCIAPQARRVGSSTRAGAKFSDRRVREALIMAYDFEWANQNLFYGLYKRTGSFFENSDMKAEGAPSPEELALLEPFRDQLPEESLRREPFSPPVSDGSGQDQRTLLRQRQCLAARGGLRHPRWRVRYTAEGQPFDHRVPGLPADLRPGRATLHPQSRPAWHSRPISGLSIPRNTSRA
jgi:microcin C transport system substrate-binding protein